MLLFLVYSFSTSITLFQLSGVALILTGVLLSIFLGKKQTIKDATA
jgi:hypothetical protein